MAIYVGGNNEHHGPCDFSYDSKKECWGTITYCTVCAANEVCEEHSICSPGIRICKQCISDAVIAIACTECTVGNVDGQCLCPQPVTALFGDWDSEPVTPELIAGSLVYDIFGPLGVM